MINTEYESETMIKCSCGHQADVMSVVELVENANLKSWSQYIIKQTQEFVQMNIKCFWDASWQQHIPVRSCSGF